MIRSMTGFGEAERETPRGVLRVEIRTVNHRSFNASLRTPAGFEGFEPRILQWLREHFARGHVKYTLTLREGGAGTAGGPVLDLELARRYREVLTRLKQELELPGQVDLQVLLRFGEILRGGEEEGRVEVEETVLRELTEEAARAAVAMREIEGRRLEADLRERLAAVRRELSVIEERAPRRLLAERDRLREAIRELTEQEEVDEDRLARELAYLAERWDINEELVRFRSHLDLFEEALAGDGATPVGKRLGFIVQEMHREANTIASKANDLEIAHASVTVREEIERLREQLENVE